MKKIFNLLIIFSLFLLITPVKAEEVKVGDNLDYYQCMAFADPYIVITREQGKYLYKSCYRATCHNAQYNLSDRISGAGYRCVNGNYDPLVSIEGNGCSKYNGACTSLDPTYCTVTRMIDCTRTSDGGTYIDKTPVQTNTSETVEYTEAPTSKLTEATSEVSKKTKKKTTKKTTEQTTETTTTTTTFTTTTSLSSNTRVSKILINETDIKYKEGDTTTTIKLPIEISEVTVDVTTEDPKAIVTVIGNTGIPEEESEIQVIVTAEDGTENIIPIRVKRYKGGNSDCTLSNIFIEDYPIDFDKNKYEYTVSLPKKVNSLDMSVLVSDEENAIYEITGNEKLKDKSVISIVVMAANGDECNYIINVKKTSNTWKFVLLIILLIGIVATAGYFLYRYLKKSKGKYRYE